jgi:hypothetical protein
MPERAQRGVGCREGKSRFSPGALLTSEQAQNMDGRLWQRSLFSSKETKTTAADGELQAHHLHGPMVASPALAKVQAPVQFDEILCGEDAPGQMANFSLSSPAEAPSKSAMIIPQPQPCWMSSRGIALSTSAGGQSFAG